MWAANDILRRIPHATAMRDDDWPVVLRSILTCHSLAHTWTAIHPEYLRFPTNSQRSISYTLVQANNRRNENPTPGLRNEARESQVGCWTGVMSSKELIPKYLAPAVVEGTTGFCASYSFSLTTPMAPSSTSKVWRSTRSRFS